MIPTDPRTDLSPLNGSGFPADLVPDARRVVSGGGAMRRGGPAPLMSRTRPVLSAGRAADTRLAIWFGYWGLGEGARTITHVRRRPNPRIAFRADAMRCA